MILMNKLAYILNEIRTLQFDIYKNENVNPDNKLQLKIKLEIKEKEKQDLTVILLKIQDEYISLDKSFKNELQIYSSRNKYRLKIFEWLKV